MRTRELINPALSIPATLWTAVCLEPGCKWGVDGGLLEVWARMKEHQEQVHHRVITTQARSAREKKGSNGRNHPTD